MESLISVIVPIYNAELYIDRCIKSILNQSYKHLEIILVDDGSTDASAKKCDEYACIDNRIKVIHKINGGVSSARNAGLDVATGAYVGFVDSDDRISPYMYEELLRVCTDQGTVATTGAYQESENGDISVKRSFSDCIVSAEIFLQNVLCRRDGTAVWSRLFPREVIGKSRFNEEKLNEEILFWLSIMLRIRKVCYTSNMGYYYFCRTGSLSHQFGKTVHDIIGNAVETKKFVNEMFPTLSKEAERFEIFQHMSFLLCCPSDYDRESDPLYRDVLSYIKKHRMAGLKNPHFTIKEKIKLIGVSFFPKSMSRLVEKKERKGNESIKK